jgi:hypothetical protein
VRVIVVSVSIMSSVVIVFVCVHAKIGVDFVCGNEKSRRNHSTTNRCIKFRADMTVQL